MCLAIPGQIIEITDDQETALVDVVGVRRHVDLRLLDKATTQCGDWVLIHVGFAMSKISEGDAMEQMRTLALLGEAESAMEEIRGYGLDESTDIQGQKLTGEAAAEK